MDVKVKAFLLFFIFIILGYLIGFLFIVIHQGTQCLAYYQLGATGCTILVGTKDFADSMTLIENGFELKIVREFFIPVFVTTGVAIPYNLPVISTGRGAFMSALGGIAGSVLFRALFVIFWILLRRFRKSLWIDTRVAGETFLGNIWFGLKYLFKSERLISMLDISYVSAFYSLLLFFLISGHIIHDIFDSLLPSNKYLNFIPPLSAAELTHGDGSNVWLVLDASGYVRLLAAWGSLVARTAIVGLVARNYLRKEKEIRKRLKLKKEEEKKCESNC